MEASTESAQCIFKTTVQVAKHATKKNHRPIFKNKRTGKSFLGKSQYLRDAENLLVQILRRRAFDYGLEQPLAGRMYTVLLFGFTQNDFYTKQGTEKLTLGDCTGLADTVMDALQTSGIVKNDATLAPLYIDRIITDQTQVEIQLWTQ